MTTNDEDVNGPVDQLVSALVEAQKAFDVPKKTKEAKIETRSGAKYSYKYATLDDCIAATRKALSEHGLAIIQNIISGAANHIGVVTTILHKSGQTWTSDPLIMPVVEHTPQSLGASITYGRRYSYCATLGLAAEEDDDLANQNSQPGKRQVTLPADNKQQQTSKAAQQQKPAAQQTAKDDPVLKNELPEDQSDKLPGPYITTNQRRRMFAIAKVHGVTDAALKSFLKDGKIYKSAEVPKDKYDGIIKAIQDGNVK
jgi:hypothetical protein